MATGLLASPHLHACISARPFTQCKSPKVHRCHSYQHSSSSHGISVTRAHARARSRFIARARQDDADQIAVRTLKETAALDDLIDVLLAAKSQQQLAKLTAENILSFNQKFWLRLATRSDAAQSKEDKERVATLANTLMLLVDAMVKGTERQLTDSAQVLQDILRAAADEKGEWFLPLPKERVDAMRAAMDRNASKLDEALLSNAFAYIRKATDDGVEGMVPLLQKILQLYAARELGRGASEGVEGFVNEVLRAEESQWAPLIREAAQAGRVSEPAFMDSLQRKMERIVLNLASGSYSQRVQAEYLKELESRAKSVFKQLA